MKDAMNMNSFKHALGNGALITSTATGDSIDVTSLNGGNDGLEFAVDITVTDGTHTFSLQDSIDNGSNWVTVSGVYLQVPTGQSAVATSATPAKTVKKFGYLGNANVGTLANSVTPTSGGKVLVRIVDTVTGSPSTGAYITAIAHFAYPQNEPAA
jgi:hypothetical protein